MDTFKLTPKGEIIINGRPLLEIIREIELPFAELEFKERVEEGEDPKELTLIAGEYIYPFVETNLLPSRNLLDKPLCIAEKGFVLEEDDPARNKALLLECTFGIT